MQMKVHVDDDLHRYWMALVHCRMELVLLYSLDGLLVQSHAKMTDKADVLRIPFRIYNQLN